MYHRYQGDRIGELDEDGIAEWYPKCKVRKEGDYYIATPHTHNPSRRTPHNQEVIAVTEEDGKYKLQEKVENPAVEANEERPVSQVVNTRYTTRKAIFDELFDRYFDARPKERKSNILQEMRGLFPNEDAAKLFVEMHWKRRWRNFRVRKQRFEYKAYNQRYEFFFTITYDNKKHPTQEDFEKSLKTAFANLTKRYRCLFQGVWEYGIENNRLHFHGLMLDPNNKLKDGLEETSEYNPKTGRKRTYLQSNYFQDKFGRNEFSEIVPQFYDQAIRYITKYLSKQGVKPYYS